MIGKDTAAPTVSRHQGDIVLYMVSSRVNDSVHVYNCDAGLSPGNLYEFRVTATNSIGAGATSDVQSFHTFSGKNRA